jgi:hypothetical protein
VPVRCVLSRPLARVRGRAMSLYPCRSLGRTLEYFMAIFIHHKRRDEQYFAGNSPAEDTYGPTCENSVRKYCKKILVYKLC